MLTMSFDVSWDVEKYREEHECEDHWMLRKTFIERWKNNYPEERLICLAQVFTNIEFMGCRYPPGVMKEVATLSQEVAKTYRNSKKTKLQRTFVSASDAAEDRAKGIKREGGIVKDVPLAKSTRINFVKQGESTESNENSNTLTNFVRQGESSEHKDSNSSINFVKQGDTTDPIVLEDSNDDIIEPTDVRNELEMKQKDQKTSGIVDSHDYLNELLQLKCIDNSRFRDYMFDTYFGRLVLLVRPWTTKLSNLQSSCQACHLQLQNTYEHNKYTILIDGRIVAEGRGDTKLDAKSVAETLAWNRLKTKVISLLIKEQWIAQNETRISVNDVSARSDDCFGTPIESSVASKMMQMMGWKGGGLGVEAQGISEPIKPNLQMVNRAGLGSCSSDIRQLRQLGVQLMRRYIASASIDVDLVFSADFSKEERAALHQCAQKAGLASRSYGVDPDRFLVVKKKLNPFAIVKAALEEGGNTAKYQVFIPIALNRNGR